MPLLERLLKKKYLPFLSLPIRWVWIVPIKINMFAWHLSLDKFLTRVVLDSHSLDVPSLLYPLSKKDMETGSHIFLSCDSTLDTWSLIVTW